VPVAFRRQHEETITMTERPALTTGIRLCSQVCTTEVIVVRPPTSDIILTCGGRPMLPLTSTVPPADAVLEAGLDTGTLLGKRYTTNDEDGFEVLVTKGGIGTLANGRTPLQTKTAKALPSSD
jgi:hypothetical protein